jgi:hypothetical protein
MMAPSASDWNDHDFNVLANGVVIGRIFKANAAQVGASWMWTQVFGHHEERTSRRRSRVVRCLNCQDFLTKVSLAKF